MDHNAANKLFFEESRENMKKVESCLLHLEDNPEDKDSINELFRNVHTIKGSSGMFGFDVIMQFTHAFETLLDKVRHDEISISDKIISVSLDANDHIELLFDFYEKNYGELPEEITTQGNELLKEINVLSGETSLEHEEVENIEDDKEVDENEKQQPIACDEENEPEELNEKVENKYWHISLRFHENVFVNALDPFSFISFLSGEGKIISIVTIKEVIPEAEFFDPEKCYLAFEIVFDTKLDKTGIADIFEFVADDCELKILPPHSEIKHYKSLINELREPIELIGEILLQSGVLTKNELDTAITIQKRKEAVLEEGEKAPLLGEILIDEKMIEPAVVDAAIKKQKENRVIVEKKKRSMRIDVLKIDHLIRFVGELVIATANLKQISEKENNREIEDASNSISRLVEEIRDSTMSIRMVPIGETFSSFKRTVRDLSKAMNKKVDLEIFGGDTELDKTLVEKIQDPIMHLVRNSIDHGLENENERIVKGKPTAGKVVLNAYYESGSVVIEVTDDGKGLNRDKIISKAIENDLIESGDNLSDKAVWDLIFAPGFSTAQEVSNVSGRGVGMDVVKSNVESLRGMIDVETIENKGTVFRMHLPLTLAIIDGFLIKVNNMHYIIPLEMVVECIDIESEIDLDRKAGDFFSLRGEIIPFIALSELFYEQDRSKNDESIIVVKYARKSAGLVVNRLIGKFQAVIKPLGKLFKNLKWISGATILGNGSVALILDIPRLIKHVQDTKMKGEVIKK